MQLSVEYDITSNATIRRNYVERQIIEGTSVEILSKIRRILVENLLNKYENCLFPLSRASKWKRLTFGPSKVIIDP